jgi:hypothetical protein
LSARPSFGAAVVVPVRGNGYAQTVNPSWEDSEVDLQRRVAVHERRIDETEHDIDKLGEAMRDAAKEIGGRIDGFRNACHEEVEGVHTEIEKLRAEIKKKDERRQWTRPEKLMTSGLLLTFIIGILGLVLNH